jgi:hypothetical protein
VAVKKNQSKSESLSEWKLLKAASQEVESWPDWLQNNAGLIFEEEQEKQRKTVKKDAGLIREREMTT